MKYHYDPQFYEFQSLQFISKKEKSPIIANYIVPDYNIPLSHRNELDAVAKNANYEIKSYPLKKNSIEEIKNKIASISPSIPIVIICPHYEYDSQINDKFKIYNFNPNLNLIRKFYQDWSPKFSQYLQNELSTGKHNFRYRLAERSISSQHRYINQIDKKIKNYENLKKEIVTRTPKNNPPIKILWSTRRWFSPKDLFFKYRSNIYLDGPLVFDIDGQLAHHAYQPCAINPKTGLCDMCIFFSKRETKRLIKKIKLFRSKKIETYFSGRSGFHTYVYDWKKVNTESLIKGIWQDKIKIDPSVTINNKSEIGFPLSLNATSGYILSKVENIDNFTPQKYDY